VLEADPNYALAYAGLADCYSLLEQAWVLPPKEAFPKAKAYVKKALEIDDSLAEAHASLGLIAFKYDWDASAAERALRKAVELSPNYASAYHWLAIFLASVGRPAEGRQAARMAVELDPLALSVNMASVVVEFVARDYQKAMQLSEQVLKLHPESRLAQMPIAWSLEALGHYDEAIGYYLKGESVYTRFSTDDMGELREAAKIGGWEGFCRKHLELLKRRATRAYVPACEIAEDYARLGQTDEVFSWLERAYESHDARLCYLGADRAFDSVRDDPRMTDLLKRIGMQKL
jgi:tetratricopeptide (TPR) repeat protein